MRWDWTGNKATEEKQKTLEVMGGKGKGGREETGQKGKAEGKEQDSFKGQDRKGTKWGGKGSEGMKRKG